MGFAVHVPHYLARAEYPQAARVLLDHVGLAAGLYLPTEALSEAAERADAEIAEQVAGSEEVTQVVQALEQQYDMVASGRGERAGHRAGRRAAQRRRAGRRGRAVPGRPATSRRTGPRTPERPR